MHLKDIAGYIVKSANETGVVKITDKPTQWDYIEDIVYRWFCILTLVLLFL